MEAFLLNSRPNTEVVTARRQHETTALSDDTTAVCVCVCVRVKESNMCMHMCEEKKKSQTTRQTVTMSASVGSRGVR